MRVMGEPLAIMHEKKECLKRRPVSAELVVKALEDENKKMGFDLMQRAIKHRVEEVVVDDARVDDILKVLKNKRAKQKAIPYKDKDGEMDKLGSSS